LHVPFRISIGGETGVDWADWLARVHVKIAAKQWCMRVSNVNPVILVALSEQFGFKNRELHQTEANK